MGWDTPDVYYNPDKFGLVIITSVAADLSYEFDMFVVWRHEDGRFFYGTDSGCSCPSPFEWAKSLEDLTEADKFAIIEALQSWTGRGYSEVSDADVVEAIEKIRAA